MGQLLSDVRSVPANDTSGNVLTGKVGETLGRPSVVRLYATGSAVGLRCTFLVGNETFMQDQEISAANRFPVIPDDFVVDGVGGPGEGVFVDLRNTTVGAITAQVRVDVLPV